MKSAFTLIEIIVAVVVVVLTSSGAFVYFSDFNSQQKLEKAKEEVVASIKLVQSYAKTRQLPIGSTAVELNYVQVQILPGGYLVAGANGIGSTYFAEKVYEGNNLMVGLTPTVLYFWPGNGFLSHDIFGTMFRNNEIAKVVIQSQNNLIGYEEVTINALGQIIGSVYRDGLSTINFPGLTPTSAPTSTPAPTATLTPTRLPTLTVTPTRYLTPTPTRYITQTPTRYVTPTPVRYYITPLPMPSRYY